MSSTTTISHCNKDIYSNGTAVLAMSGCASSEEMEQWVQKIAKITEQPVDWFIMGGRDIVLTTGDVDKVTEVIKKHLPELKGYPIRIGPPPAETP